MHRLLLTTLVAALMLAAPGHAALSTDENTTPALHHGAEVTPLMAPAPEWLTPEVVERTVAAGEQGMGYDAFADVLVDPVDQRDPEALSVPYLFIRPGALMTYPAICTMNFIYDSGTRIGTAGHCTGVDDRVIIAGLHPGILFYVGTTSVSVDNGPGDDYALVDIDDQWEPYVDEDTAVVAGPGCGSYTGDASLFSPVAVKHYGHGLVVGTGGTPRAGVSYAKDDATVYWDSPSAPGDSGSPVLTAATGCDLGQAYGVLTHLVIFGDGFQVIAGTNIEKVPATVDSGNGLPT